jgi:hypothetical protein
MIQDKLLKLSDSQAVTVSAASTNVINQGKANPSEAEVYIVCQVREAATAAGAATVAITIETSVDEAFTAPITLFSSAAIGKAALTLNKEVFKIEMPANTKQYIRGYYSVATGPLTAGKFDLFLTDAIEAR